MSFSTKECAWAQSRYKFLGRTMIGIRGVETNLTINADILYGAGSVGIDITEGNEKVEGYITALKYEVDGMNDAAQAAGYPTIAHVPFVGNILTCEFKLFEGAPSRIITIPSLKITGLPFGWNQGDLYMEVKIPFIATQMILSKS